MLLLFFFFSKADRFGACPSAPIDKLILCEWLIHYRLKYKPDLSKCIYILMFRRCPLAFFSNCGDIFVFYFLALSASFFFFFSNKRFDRSMPVALSPYRNQKQVYYKNTEKKTLKIISKYELRALALYNWMAWLQTKHDTENDNLCC